MVQRGPGANDRTKIEPRKRQHRRAGRVVDSSRARPTSKIANLLRSLAAVTPYRPGRHAGRLPKSTHGPWYRRGCAAEQDAALRGVHQYRAGAVSRSVGMYVSSILTPKSKMAVTHITSHAPQRAAAWVGRSGGPSRDGRRCRRPGGSVGRAPRTTICSSALCAAGRSVWTCRVGNRSFYYRGSVGRDAMTTFNFAPPYMQWSLVRMQLTHPA